MTKNVKKKIGLCNRHFLIFSLIFFPESPKLRVFRFIFYLNLLQNMSSFKRHRTKKQSKISAVLRGVHVLEIKKNMDAFAPLSPLIIIMFHAEG